MKKVDREMRAKMHEKLEQLGWTLDDFSKYLGSTHEEAKNVLYGPGNNIDVKEVPEAHYNKALELLEV